jgi:hypothetical protein
VGRGYTEAIKKIAEGKGAKIRLGAEVTWIWRKDVNSPVAGVEIKTPKGKKNIKIKKALVLASGGFSRDIKMRAAFNPGIVPEFNCTNHPGATGEMLRFAQSIGLIPCSSPSSSSIPSRSPKRAFSIRLPFIPSTVSVTASSMSARRARGLSTNWNVATYAPSPRSSWETSRHTPSSTRRW